MTVSQLPSHASVIVIGGGVMGCSTLYHLAEMGATDAILLERNKLTSGTTWHSAAQVRALRHSQNLTRMIQYSVDLYARNTGVWIGKSHCTTRSGLLNVCSRLKLLSDANVEVVLRALPEYARDYSKK